MYTHLKLEWKIACLFVLLFAIDFWLFFRHAGHFFQADTIFLLDHRPTSLLDLLREFARLQPAGRYRPLSHSLLPAILFPIFGLTPIPYRIPVYTLFLAATAGVYLLVMRLTRRRLAAVIAALFFNIHTVNAYTTYDLGFAPELFYTVFFIAAVLAYLKYVDDGSKSGYSWSLILLVTSLLSKEAAVTLPVVLFGLQLLKKPDSRRWHEHLSSSLRSLIPHVVIVAAYVLFALVYLNTLPSDLLERPEKHDGGAYHMIFDNTVVKNASLAFAWAFQLPADWWGQWRRLTELQLAWLKIFALIVAGVTIIMFFGRQRKWPVFGTFWFLVTLAPMLPLINHFIPYYLFLPLAGLALIVGVAFTKIYDVLNRFQPAGAVAVLLAVFAANLYVNAAGIHGDIQNNRLLGGSAVIAASSLSDLRHLYPVLMPGTRIYFDDEEEPLNWEHSSGGLLRMAYGTDQLDVRYASSSEVIFLPPDEKTILLAVRDRHLVDNSLDYRADPLKFIRFAETSPYELRVSTAKVTSGDTYVVEIPGLRDVRVHLMYRFNDGPPQSFPAMLDHQGCISYGVSANIPPGKYTFIGFSIPAQRGWIRSDKTVIVSE